MYNLSMKKDISARSLIVACAKSVRIRNYSGPYVPAFGLNTKRYFVSLVIRSECRKIRTRITPNTDTFYGALDSAFLNNSMSTKNLSILCLPENIFFFLLEHTQIKMLFSTQYHWPVLKKTFQLNVKTLQ